MKSILSFSLVVLVFFVSKAQQTWSSYGGIPSAATKISAIDISGNKWVAMYGGGISKFKPDETYDNFNSSNSGMPENFALCVTIDNNGKKWIGTNSSGIVTFDGTNWVVLNTSNGLPGNQINAITQGNGSEMWIGLNLNGLSRYSGSTFTNYNTGNSALPNNNVNCITKDANGNIWVGTYEGLVKIAGTQWTVYPVGSSAADHQVYSVAIENSNTIWVGTGGGLWKFDGNSTWTNYNTSNSGLPYNYINCVAIDGNSTKWIGTTQGGMASFDGISSWSVFNTSNSNIPGNDVRHISVDSYNNLWVCTNGGFAQYGFPSSDASLSDLQTDGVTVPGFSPTVLEYHFYLPQGTSIVPVTTATPANANAFCIINDAFSLPGTSTVDVYAEDGITIQTYLINFYIITTDNATLSDLKYGGQTVPGFSPVTYLYNVVLPYGTSSPPPVTATPANQNSSVVITNATSLPGTATVDVTSEDLTTTLTYTINFTVANPNTDASLSDLMIEGATVQGFNPAIFDYNVELPYGTTEVPAVTAIQNDINATVQITDAVSLPGTTTIIVTAEDGLTSNTYNIHFTVSLQINEIFDNYISIYPIPTKGEITLVSDSEYIITFSDVSNRIFFRNKTNEKSAKFDLSKYESGIYYIQIEKEGYLRIKKIIIQH